MDTAAFIKGLTSDRDYAGQIVHTEHIPARPAKYSDLERPLPPELQSCLDRRHLLPLYTHQAAAVNFARRGLNVIVATPSASGKSLCYNTAVMESILTQPFSRSIYLFPTKALAQDQLRSLRDLFSPGIIDVTKVATFDGDTPAIERGEIRKNARIVLSNPDMLHVGILPNHNTWSRFLRNLKYVVVDEAHSYRGVFGSHVADVLRRLRRICRLYGASPQFILSSATIANPEEHAERLVGLPFEVVENDGSPHGPKEFVFWDPPLIDKAKTSRRSTNTEATTIFTELIRQKVRTLTFARTRKLTELIYIYSKRRLSEIAPNFAERIGTYRAGYLAQDRRNIEQALFRGELLGVVATTALEMGIDIGDLDATVLTGYPGSIASTWQQAGRSGRRKEGALSFLIAMNNPLDQYFMRHPETFFRRGFENALVNPENPYILRAHLLCAAWEMPLRGEDENYFGPGYMWARMELEKEGLLRERNGKWYVSPTTAYPAQGMSIRSTSGRPFYVVESQSNNLIETLEDNTALFQVHQGAIYLHQGDAYLVEELDLASRTAYVTPSDANYYTQAKDLTDLRIVKERQHTFFGEVGVYVGDVEVTTTIVGYKSKAQFTEEVIGEEPLDLPPQHFNTVAVWFDLPPAALERLEKEQLDFAGGLHAAEHAAIGILPLFALCDRNDIGGVSTPFHPDTGKPQIFIYDAYPGGVGIAEKGYEFIRNLWQATLSAVTECPCEDGCPACVQSPKCGNNNEPLDKRAAMVLLAGLLGKY